MHTHPLLWQALRVVLYAIAGVVAAFLLMVTVSVAEEFSKKVLPKWRAVYRRQQVERSCPVCEAHCRLTSRNTIFCRRCKEEWKI
jgi:hypothetical protein